ncbi:MAG: adenylate/guanylate cyclase domain-containing protein [Gammaproteobacteria bacterium]
MAAQIDNRVVYTDKAYESRRNERTVRLLSAGIALVFIHAFFWSIWGFATNELELQVVNLIFAVCATAIFPFRHSVPRRVLAHVVLLLAFCYSTAGVIFFDGMVQSESPIEHLWFIVVAVSAWLILGVDENSKDRIYANIYVVACFTMFMLVELPVIEFPPLAPQPLESRPLAHSVTKIIMFSFLLAITNIYMRDIRSAQKFLTLANETLENLVENVLPTAVSARLRLEGKTFAQGHPTASVLFADLVGFTDMSARMPPMALVQLLDELFTQFDKVTDELGLEKIKTIGDAYMVAAGLPEAREDHAVALVELALRMRAEIAEHGALGIRFGINSGEVVAGVIGRKRLFYDLWGDTVNIASRMESHGRKNEIQITKATYDLVKDNFDCEYRGKIALKGMPDMDAYIVNGRKAA